jgi:hypothetical protein
MDFNSLKAKARSLFEQRGGTPALKEDAQELKDIATGPGSLADKGKAAAEALKDPGAPGPAATPREPATSNEPEPPRTSGT